METHTEVPADTDSSAINLEIQMTTVDSSYEEEQPSQVVPESNIISNPCMECDSVDSAKEIINHADAIATVLHKLDVENAETHTDPEINITPPNTVDSSKIIEIEDTIPSKKQSVDHLEKESMPTDSVAPADFLIDKSDTQDEDDSDDMDQTDTNYCSYLSYNFEDTSILELGYVEYPTDHKQNYARGCKWSPDGTCLLYAIKDIGMSVVELPPDLYSGSSVEMIRPVTQLKRAVHVPGMMMVYDFAWFPEMTSTNPVTCCWLATSQHEPVKLWDAYTGELRCTYRGYDQYDEIVAALSVCFSTDGKQVYCGYKQGVRTFHTDIPGRDCTYYKMREPISCIASNPVSPGQIALGSWTKSIHIVNDKDGTVRSFKKITGHFGGITHLKFSPDGIQLYTGARKDNEVICWDMRAPGRPIHIFKRQSDTNQRIYFDISPFGDYLFSGSTTGAVDTWKIDDFSEADSEPLKLKLHADAVNSVSLHPFRPILATGSGQHHFLYRIEDEELDECYRKYVTDNSIRLWWLGSMTK